jgi:hypothetical protein
MSFTHAPGKTFAAGLKRLCGDGVWGKKVPEKRLPIRGMQGKRTIQATAPGILSWQPRPLNNLIRTIVVGTLDFCCKGGKEVSVKLLLYKHVDLKLYSSYHLPASIVFMLFLHPPILLHRPILTLQTR